MKRHTEDWADVDGDQAQDEDAVEDEAEDEEDMDEADEDDDEDECDEELDVVTSWQVNGWLGRVRLGLRRSGLGLQSRPIRLPRGGPRVKGERPQEAWSVGSEEPAYGWGWTGTKRLARARWDLFRPKYWRNLTKWLEPKRCLARQT
ncbi:MAG: hypothetical protein QI223_05505 [Candidatus Korarchaeota archaeon]|nr:hypothetical protein [Candidatus Korarchaeota archaeon]